MLLSYGTESISSRDSLNLLLGPNLSAGISLYPSGIHIFITQGTPVLSAKYCDISIHLDPVITDDEQINELRKITNQIISTIDARLSMHDFRVMRGPMMKKLMFDVVVPYDFEISDDVLKKKVNSYIKIYDENCYAVINIDRAMVR